jgi:4-hydroxy-2-oxoheptanedioate aldolase
MKENLVKKKIAEKQPVYGIISNILDPTVAEILGFAGHDFYMIDGEHSQVSTSDIVNIIRACEISGTTPLARVRSNDAKLILQYLDAGIMGVMMPGIQTANEVEKLVKAMKYPPVGERGMGLVRAADYMMGKMNQATYVNFANDNTLVLPQVEDMKAVKNLPEMVKVAGVDGFIIGPRDLAMYMGFYDGPAHDEVKKVIDQIFEVVLNAGLMIGTVASNADQAKALIDKGAGFVMNSVAGLLSSASATFLKK